MLAPVINLIGYSLIVCKYVVFAMITAITLTNVASS